MRKKTTMKWTTTSLLAIAGTAALLALAACGEVVAVVVAALRPNARHQRLSRHLRYRHPPPRNIT